MNHVKFIAVLLFMLMAPSCKKDKDKDPDVETPGTFSQINLRHIKQKEALMSDAVIQTSGVNGVGWKMGEVYVYRTRSGLYGKFRVGAIDPDENYKLTISAVTYNADGSIHGEAEKIVIRGTYGADLENLVEGTSMGDIDFQWVRQNQATTIFTPTNGGAFIVYRLD